MKSLFLMTLFLYGTITTGASAETLKSGDSFEEQVAEYIKKFPTRTPTTTP